MLQGAVPGGQRSTTDVDNAPGFAQGMLGPVLIERSVREAVASGALPALDSVTTQVITPLAHGAVALVEAAVGMWLSPQHR